MAQGINVRSDASGTGKNQRGTIRCRACPPRMPAPAPRPPIGQFEEAAGRGIAPRPLVFAPTALLSETRVAVSSAGLHSWPFTAAFAAAETVHLWMHRDANQLPALAACGSLARRSARSAGST